ncbi:MAG: hypothetical protein Q4F72_07350 [Desulfovibrionaceae bacterium]|nr:hypothetical protein [Desulfovibrionaceae bacterium]
MNLNNVYLKYALIFAGGLVTGLAVSGLCNRGCLTLKPVAAGIISRGMDVKDAVASAVEKVKEDVQDIAAEARADQAQRRAAKG